jgi:heptose-I-phosphate ethanolaminephosphotransferase
MKIKNILLNKYTLSLFILLLCLAADIIIHKGMSRVMLPENFTDERTAKEYPMCEQTLFAAGKKWVKGINSIDRMRQVDTTIDGFEVDVYFDTVKNYLEVYHDSSAMSGVSLDDLLKLYKARNLTAPIWLDFKNLSAANEKQSLQYISSIRYQYNLHNKMIIESSSPQLLQSFCDSNFFTSYYVPLFNPYQVSEKKLVTLLDSMNQILSKYKVASLSGYYFQYPVLKKFFPKYPLLTWIDKSSLSFIGRSFQNRVLSDDHVKVVLCQWQ